jgi:dTDP-glucose pyrophosphorylase
VIVMKVLILAAGKGVRMQPLTYEVPKPLIMVNGQPFLYYIIKNLKEAGLDEIGIVVGYKEHMIEAWLRDNKINAYLIRQKKRLGTGHAIKLAKEWVNGENFIVVMGDDLYSPNDIKAIANDDEFCYVAGLEHEHPERFGVLVCDGDFLKEIEEKPEKPKSNLINAALYKFTPEIFAAIEKTPKNPKRGEYEITDAISLLCKQKKVKITKIHDYWVDMGRLEDLPKVKEFIEKHFSE